MMKTRESGMPDEETWSSFFSPEETLLALGLKGKHIDVVDFGCGYGTFAIAAARMTTGQVIALDIDPEMLSFTKKQTHQKGIENLRLVERDFMMIGSGLREESIDFAMLFNILHAEQPVELTREAYRVLRPGGVLAVMHWRYDPKTPRGPSMDIRPRPEQCVGWCQEVGFEVEVGDVVQLPPYHYGFRALKKLEPH